MNSNFRLKNHLLLAALAAVYPVLGHTAAAARVEFATGNVMAVSSAGPRPLTRGAELNTGETINTGDGRAQLRFADGAMMSLQPNTEFRIDDYNFSGKNDGSEKGFFSLLRGGLRTISGYIGKGNRDAYKVTTSVATIGIRGTEWSGNLTPGTNPEDTRLDLGTGEGAIEVCNAGGCIVVASGESAVVTGFRQPQRTDVRPNLPPSNTVNPPPKQDVYTPAEDRAPDGTLVIVDDTVDTVDTVVPKFTSGSGFVAAASGLYNNGEGYSLYDDQKSSTSVTFSDGVQVTAAQGNTYNYHSPASVVEAKTLAETDGSAEAVIGWGRWTGGTATYGSDYPLEDAHYVVGKPTADVQILAISGNYEYNKVGATTPTWGNNISPYDKGTGTLNSASLRVNFNGNMGYNATLAVNVTADGKTFNITHGNNSLNLSYSSTFSGSGAGSTSDGHSANLSYKGILAGSNAKYAGVTYGLEELGGNSTKVHGAVAFTKGGIVQVPQ